jgi:hypothetical protein
MDKLKTLGIAGTILNLSGSPFVANFPLSVVGWVIYAFGAMMMTVFAVLCFIRDKKRRIAIDGIEAKNKSERSWISVFVQMLWFFGWNVSAILTRMII